MIEMEVNQSISNPDKTMMLEDFKLMVKNIAEDINDLSKLMYMCGMNNTGSDRDKMTALDIFWKLEKRGKFAHDNVGPLESLSRSIDRCDLVTKHIEPYKQKYGRFTGEFTSTFKQISFLIIKLICSLLIMLPN